MTQHFLEPTYGVFGSDWTSELTDQPVWIKSSNWKYIAQTSPRDGDGDN